MTHPRSQVNLPPTHDAEAEYRVVQLLETAQKAPENVWTPPVDTQLQHTPADTETKDRRRNDALDVLGEAASSILRQPEPLMRFRTPPFNLGH